MTFLEKRAYALLFGDPMRVGSAESVKTVPRRSGATAAPRAWLARAAILRTLLVAVGAWLSAGCTLIGLGVGSGIERRPEYHGPDFEAPEGSTVSVYLVSPPRDPNQRCVLARARVETVSHVVCE